MLSGARPCLCPRVLGAPSIENRERKLLLASAVARVKDAGEPLGSHQQLDLLVRALALQWRGALSHSSDLCVIEGLNAYYLSVVFSSCQSNVSGLGFCFVSLLL